MKPETGAHKLTVVGKVDPAKLREKVAGKLKKKVELISPQPKKEKSEKEKDDNSNKKQPEKATKDDKKPKEVSEMRRLVLFANMRLSYCAHCYLPHFGL